MIDFAVIRAMTFDCYGTLVDWERGILGALRPLCERSGVDVSDDELLVAYARAEAHVERGHWRPYRDVLREVMRMLSVRFGVPAGEWDDETLVRSLPEWPAFPDTVESLRALSAWFPLGIISNVDDDLFEQTARRLDVEFDWVVTAEQAQAYKPAHRIFRLARDRIGVHPSRIAHVAQSRFHDVAPARLLGWNTVWVNRRRGEPGPGATVPAPARPHVVVHDLRSLVERVRARLGEPARSPGAAPFVI